MERFSSAQRRSSERPDPRHVREDLGEPSLFEKLSCIMSDPELATELGGLLEQLKLPAFEAHGKITAEQHRRLMEMSLSAVKETLPARAAESVERVGLARAGETSEFIAVH